MGIGLPKRATEIRAPNGGRSLRRIVVTLKAAGDARLLGQKRLPTRPGLCHQSGMAKMKNAAAVAREAGNSPAMIFSNYRELVTPQDAEAWFGIGPEDGKVKGKR